MVETVGCLSHFQAAAELEGAFGKDLGSKRDSLKVTVSIHSGLSERKFIRIEAPCSVWVLRQPLRKVGECLFWVVIVPFKYGVSMA